MNETAKLRNSRRFHMFDVIKSKESGLVITSPLSLGICCLSGNNP